MVDRDPRDSLAATETPVTAKRISTPERSRGPTHRGPSHRSTTSEPDLTTIAKSLSNLCSMLDRALAKPAATERGRGFAWWDDTDGDSSAPVTTRETEVD